MKHLFLMFLISLLVLSPFEGFALGSEPLDTSHRAYGFVNQMIHYGLVDGYTRGFRVSRTDRDNIARYISQIFSGMTAEEVFQRHVLKESDLTTLGELVDEFILELSSSHSANLSNLLETSMRLRTLMDKDALDQNETRFNAGSTRTADTSTADIAATHSSSTPSTGGALQPLPDQELTWDRRGQKNVTLRDIRTSNQAGFELNNAEKKAGKTIDVNLNFQNSATDSFGEEVIRESGFFQTKNTDLYDYMLKYDNVIGGRALSWGYKLRPDITEYTYRGEELNGLLLEYKYGPRSEGLAMLGSVKMDNAGSDEVRTIGWSHRFFLSNRYALRLTLLDGGDTNRLFSLENSYRPDSRGVHEFEWIDSAAKGITDHAYEYRWKQSLRKKMILSFKYKNLGEDYSSVWNPSLLSENRKSDLRHSELVLNYKFTPFIQNTTTLIHSNENNELQAAPRIPIDTHDYTSIFISSVPKKPKFMIYLKDQLKTGTDGGLTSKRDDSLKLALFKIDHKFGKLVPRLGYTMLKLDYNDMTLGTPVILLTDSKTRTIGFDYLFDSRLTLKLDWQNTRSDSQVDTTAGGVTTRNTSFSDSKVTTLVLNKQFDQNNRLSYTWYREDRSGTESVDKRSHLFNYNRRINQYLDCSLLFERIRYNDLITAGNTYKSDEYALTINHQF